MAAWRAESLGLSPALINVGVPGTPDGLGGFAPFSGAKFSLFPAGTGIAALVGGDDGLIHRYSTICADLRDLGFGEFHVTEKEIIGREVETDDGLAYRSYHSILLSPTRIEALLAALVTRLERTTIVPATVAGLAVNVDGPFRVLLAGGEVLSARTLIVAAGRLGANLLKDAGIPEMPGKGIDVGVRLGFASRTPVAGLRGLGPDAKFMADGVRTFCLNSPGKIFHYPGLGFRLPGGIVAGPDWPQSNVGILCRLEDRQATLRHLIGLAPSGDAQPLSFVGRGNSLEWTHHALNLIGGDAASRIDRFVQRLVESGLVALPPSYSVHYPLLDWHWPVFSLAGRLETSVPGILAAGDASGHARGLMQAALMGVLAVEESLS